MPKYAQFSNVLELRIRQGDYTVRELPTEQELADEVGVSRTTARRAMLRLMEKGLLLRKPHGKVVVNQEHQALAGRLRLAFMAPAFSSPEYEKWRFAVDRSAVKFGANVRMVDFVHWDDPAIPQTLAGFDGVFLVPSSEPIPPAVMARLGATKNLVVLDGDFSRHGIPSVQLLSPMFVHRLADHLHDLGHRRIDCLNTQPHDDVVLARIEQWRLWQRVRKTGGRLIDEPVEAFMHAAPKAHAVMSRLLDAGQFNATALLCITDPAAMGAIRALHDHGRVTGKDISVCAVAGGGLARYQVPSLTVLETPDPAPYLEVCLDWFQRRNDPWVGPLLVQPGSLSLFIGESTGPVPAGAPTNRVSNVHPVPIHSFGGRK